MTIKRILWTAFVGLLAIPFLMAADAARVPDGLATSVIGAAGAPAVGGSVVANGTLAQSQPIGTASGSGRILHAGFWPGRGAILTGVRDSDTVPNATGLLGNAPNPFNPSTRINFELADAQNVRLEVYDARGVLVRTLTHEVLPAGRYHADWNGTDDTGRRAASGVYFYRLRAGDHQSVKKMLMLK